MSDGELAVARTIRVLLIRVNGWWCRLLFDCCQPLLLRQRSVSGFPPLALISQLVCHNCSVPGFTDGAGFRFGWMLSAVVTEAIPFVCDDVVKTENLDWIFPLDVSLL
jgi:hypothetical protein